MTFMQPPVAAAGWEESFGMDPMLFETQNTADTRHVVTRIDATTAIRKYNTGGELVSGETSVYQNTDYSSPDLVLRLILLPADE